MLVHLKNEAHGRIPDYWNVPLSAYNTEVCFVTKDSVVAAPRLLIRTIFPDFDSMLCSGCVDSHERITVIIKDTSSSRLEDAFKLLAAGNPEELAELLELQPLQQSLADAAASSEEDENAYQDQEEQTDVTLEQNVDIDGERLEEDTDVVVEFDNNEDDDQSKYEVEREFIMGDFLETEEEGNPSKSLEENVDIKDELISDLSVCSKCDKLFNNAEELESHVKDEHITSKEQEVKKKIKVPCPNKPCRHNANSIEQLHLHLNKCGKKITKVPKNQINLKCKSCDFVAKSQLKLYNHLQKEHRQGTEITNDRSSSSNEVNKVKKMKLVCESDGCSFSTKVKSKYRKHSKTHDLSCKYCPFQAKTKHWLNLHMKIEHPILSCVECGREFKNAGALDKHVTKEHMTPAVCSLCEETFPSKRELNFHTKALHPPAPAVRKEREIKECRYCKHKMKNISNHEKFCIYKNKLIKGYQGSRLFQDGNDWI